MSHPISIYLDHAAATPVDEQVLAAMQPYFREQFFNPSATYLAAEKVHADMEQARTDIAFWLGVQPSEIYFTAGGTEANNLVIEGIMSQYPSGNMVVSAIEHESIVKPALAYDSRIAPVMEDGRMNVEKLSTLIDDTTVLVSIMYANNEIGTIEPIHDIALMLKNIRSNRKSGLPLYFHTDACQAANYLDLHAIRLGVDAMTLNGGKIYGPKQSGALYVKRSLQLKPLVLGGGQERGLRSGTENVPGIIGLSKALVQTQALRHEESKRLQGLQKQFIDHLTKAIPFVVVNGSQKHRLPNNVHITFPGHDNERLLIELDEHGIMAAAGSACSASDDEPSHVLKAIGLSEDDSRSSLRFTMGRATTESDIYTTVEALKKIVR